MCDWCGCGQPNNSHPNTEKLHQGMRTTARQDMKVKSTMAKTTTTVRRSRQAAVR